jgi:hypothetical protein
MREAMRVPRFHEPATQTLARPAGVWLVEPLRCSHPACPHRGELGYRPDQQALDVQQGFDQLCAQRPRAGPMGEIRWRLRQERPNHEVLLRAEALENRGTSDPEPLPDRGDTYRGADVEQAGPRGVDDVLVSNRTWSHEFVPLLSVLYCRPRLLLKTQRPGRLRYVAHLSRGLCVDFDVHRVSRANRRVRLEDGPCQPGAAVRAAGTVVEEEQIGARGQVWLAEDFDRMAQLVAALT